MTTRHRRMAYSGVLGLLAAVGCATQAQASGFQLREQSSEGLGNAFAGATAKAYNLSTVYYNPAGMTRLQGDQVAGSVTWIAPVAEFSGTNTLGVTQTAGSMGGDAIKDAAVGAVYAMWDYRPDLKFGIAVTAPFGLRSEYDEDWVGRYHALHSDLTNINITPSVAYRINDNLSIGAGVQIAYTKARLTKALNQSALSLGAITRDGETRLEGEDFGFGGDVGLLWEFSKTSRVGLNYRSQVKHTLDGDVKFDVHPLLAGNPAFQNSDAQADLTTPDTVALGIYHELSPQWAVMSDIQWTNWSTFNELRVKFDDGRADDVTPENWHDTWFFSLGATYTMNEKHKFHFGVAYDQAPMDDADRTARIPDANRYWLSGGYTYNFSPNFQGNLGYTHIFADKAKINEAGTTPGSGTLTGEYDAHVDILSASFVMKF